MLKMKENVAFVTLKNIRNLIPKRLLVSVKSYLTSKRESS